MRNISTKTTQRVKLVEFLTVRDFRAGTADVWQKLEQDGKIVLTNNGKPTALMINLIGQDFESVLNSVNQAEFTRAVNNMREIAAQNGYMTEEEIEAEIQAARAERKERGNAL
jgi:antitoxin (DNA-binding transcriptional repressor) of toxin-antitoxin stability system